MKRAPAILLPWILSASLGAEPFAGKPMPARGQALLAQNIFDDEPETPAEKPQEKPAKKPAGEVKSESGEVKPVKTSKRRKKGGKKKKKAAAAESAKSGYSTAEVARSSYEWAPDSEPFALRSTAPGLRTTEAPAAKTATPPPAAKQEINESKPASQGFRLPQIPLAQVLIVAGFVLLFLIYRFRVGKQIKRKKY